MKLFGFKFSCFGGQNEIQLYARSLEHAECLAKVGIEEALRIEKKYSVFLETSIISEIKRAAGNTEINLDQETLSLFEYAANCFYESDGLFDITTGPLRRIWDFKNKKIPSLEQITQAKKLVGFDKIILEESKIFLPVPSMELDFGGIGKEYAVDRVATLLTEQGALNALINFGGDIKALGPHIDGAPWLIGIAHPRKPGEILTKIPLYSGSLATSGDYERYYEIDGKRYCHIINPVTGYSVDDIQGITVISESCLAAGSLASISMLVGEDKAREMLEGERYLLINSNSEIYSQLKENTSSISCSCFQSQDSYVYSS